MSLQKTAVINNLFSSGVYEHFKDQIDVQGLLERVLCKWSRLDDPEHTLKTLLENEASRLDVNKVTGSGATVLQMAISALATNDDGDIEFSVPEPSLLRLVKASAKLSAAGDLHAALVRGSPVIVEALLDHKVLQMLIVLRQPLTHMFQADVDAVNEESVAPLLFSVRVDDTKLFPSKWRARPDDQLEVLRLLIDHGANLDQTDGEGLTALFYAIAATSFTNIKDIKECGIPAEAALMLIEAGAGTNTAHEGMTCIYAACLRGEHSIVEALVSAGSSVNALGYKGFTPIQTFLWYSEYQQFRADSDPCNTVKLLLDANATTTIDSRAETSWTALHMVRKPSPAACLVNSLPLACSGS